MRYLASLSLVAITMTFLMFQNCSKPQYQDNSGTSVNMSLIYPYYEKKPDYFENVQLTSVFADSSNLWHYQFVASVVSIENADQDINVDIQIRDQHDNVLCPRFTATVKNTSNHMEIPDCISSKKVSKTKIEVRAKLATTTTYQLVNTYEFEL